MSPPRTFLGAAALVVAVLGTSATAACQGACAGVAGAPARGPDAGLLTRRKRYVVFPRGCSLNLVYCLSYTAYIPFSSIFVFGITAGLSWPLPTEPHQVYLQRRDAGRHPDREHRVGLYQSVRAFLGQRGLQGEDCVRRTICESSHPGQRGKGTFMEEVIKILFTLPEEGDAEARTAWDAARHNGAPCETRFPNCSSVLDISLPIGKKGIKF